MIVSFYFPFLRDVQRLSSNARQSLDVRPSSNVRRFLDVRQSLEVRPSSNVRQPLDVRHIFKCSECLRGWWMI
jgi:hypothetical protein